VMRLVQTFDGDSSTVLVVPDSELGCRELV
jgi:hypothetical protein